MNNLYYTPLPSDYKEFYLSEKYDSPNAKYFVNQSLSKCSFITLLKIGDCFQSFPKGLDNDCIYISIFIPLIFRFEKSNPRISINNNIVINNNSASYYSLLIKAHNDKHNIYAKLDYNEYYNLLEYAFDDFYSEVYNFTTEINEIIKFPERTSLYSKEQMAIYTAIRT